MSTSIRNRLPGTIEKIVSDKVVSEVVIRTAAGDVTSVITTGSVKQMNLNEGDTVVVFNRTRSKAEPLLGPCGTFSDSPAKLADQVDILFTMLAHPGAVEEAGLSAKGFLNGLRANALWVDCSSTNPSFSKKMAAEAAMRQIRFVDAPVTGSAAAAADAKLVFWV